MTHLKHLGMIALVAVAIAGLLYFTRPDYSKPVDDEYHKQCPNPADPNYYDCDWWPKKRQ